MQKGFTVFEDDSPNWQKVKPKGRLEPDERISQEVQIRQESEEEEGKGIAGLIEFNFNDMLAQQIQSPSSILNQHI
jgi:hypothetical protein